MFHLRRISLLGLLVAGAATLTAKPARADGPCYNDVVASDGETCTVCDVTCEPGGGSGYLWQCPSGTGNTCPDPT